MVKKIITFLKYPLMIFLVAYLILSGKFNFGLLKDFFSFHGLCYLAVVMLLLFITQLLFSVRYKLFMKVLGYFTRLKPVFSITMVGLFYNNFLPGGTGGDVARAYYTKHLFGVPLPAATATTLLDRIIALLGLLVVTVLSFVGLVCSKGNTAGVFSEQKIAISIAVLIPLSIIMCLFLIRLPSIYSILQKLFSKFIFGKAIASVFDTFRVLMTHTKTLGLSLILCIMGHIITISCVTLLAWFLYGTQAVKPTLVFSGLVFLLSAVPVTPGNIGWTEWLADSFYRSMGMDGGATVFILWRLVLLLFSLAGGFIYLRIHNMKENK